MHPFLPLLLKVCAALALACQCRLGFFTAVLLFANNSNPILLGCITYYLRCCPQLLDQLAEFGFAPLWAHVAAAASAYIGHVHPDDVSYDAPFLDRTCADIVTSNEELVAYYKTRVPPKRVPRLCPNGDHGTIEETLIILREHGQKIVGAMIMAVFLSALCKYVVQTAGGLVASATATVTATVANSATTTTIPGPSNEDFQAEFASIFDAPRPFYRLPSDDDAGSLALYHPDGPLPSFVVDLGMSVADARKAMRASQAACIHKAAEAYADAVRRRIIQENRDADNGFTGGIHTDPDRDAEAVIGMRLFGLDRGLPPLPPTSS